MSRSLGRLGCLLQNITYPPPDGSNISLNNCADYPQEQISLGHDFDLPNRFLIFEQDNIKQPISIGSFNLSIYRDSSLQYAKYAYKIYQLSEQYRTLRGTTSDENIISFENYSWNGNNGMLIYLITAPKPNTATAGISITGNLADFYAPDTISFSSICNVEITE